MLLIVLGILIFIVWAYVLFIRDWMNAKWPEQYGWWYKTEELLWSQSRTILAARFYWVAGIFVSLQQLAVSAGIDVTPFINQLAEWVPEGYRSLAISGFLIITGVGFEWLRHLTTDPISAGEDK